MDNGEVDGVGMGVGSAGSSQAPDLGAEGLPPAHRCFWAILLLALTVFLLAGFLHVDVGLLVP